jgi:hypothetical protein
MGLCLPPSLSEETLQGFKYLCSSDERA